MERILIKKYIFVSSLNPCLLPFGQPSVMQSLGASGTALLDLISNASTSDLTRDWIDRLQVEATSDHKRVRRRSAPVGRGSSGKMNRSTSSLVSVDAGQSSCGPRDVIVETELPYLLNTLDDHNASSIIIYHIQVRVVEGSRVSDGLLSLFC